MVTCSGWGERGGWVTLHVPTLVRGESERSGRSERNKEIRDIREIREIRQIREIREIREPSTRDQVRLYISILDLIFPHRLNIYNASPQ